MALDGHLAGTLKTWRTKQVAERLALGESYRDGDDLVFTWQDGGPVPTDYVTSERMVNRPKVLVPSVTPNVYADAIPEDDIRAVDTFTKAVWGN